MTDFASYNQAVFSAYQHNQQTDDVISKKQEIVATVCAHYNLAPKKILFVGFNPAMLSAQNLSVYITEITTNTSNELKKLGANFQLISTSDWSKYNKAFDCVIAAEEYLTFAQDDVSQREMIVKLAALTKNILITTVKDYKNLEFKDREFSVPAVIKTASSPVLFFEHHNHDPAQRGSWESSVYQIKDQALVSYGPYTRRTMYFKQLAKFCSDAGSKGFLVHKNLMYKSLIKKNYEHVISIQF